MKKWIVYSVLLSVLVTVIAVYGAYVVGVWIRERPEIVLNIKKIVDRYGLSGIFLVMIIAGTFIPLGSPVIIAYGAGFALPLIPLIITSVIGFSIGITINYYLAFSFGRPYVMRRLSKERFVDLTTWWNKWGMVLYIVFGITPVPPLFDYLALICGVFKMPLKYFLLITVTTRIVQFSAFAYLGKSVGQWIGLI